MPDERRTAERVKVNLPTRWEGVLTQREGTITDISATGCFILTPGEVADRELVRVEIELPTGGKIYLWGEVLNIAPEIGFAVRFTGFTEKEQTMLDLLVDYYRGKQ
ncbi:MAG TPA: PilZ domain-containing protein [Pyrinomonadaceae bacterium]|nr:PilZ domain-containing protein [Pyrinomonadaceae bacterium]